MPGSALVEEFRTSQTLNTILSLRTTTERYVQKLPHYCACARNNSLHCVGMAEGMAAKFQRKCVYTRDVMTGYRLLFVYCRSLCAVLSAVDMTFTTKNVLRTVQEVKDTDRLGCWLGVPELKRHAIQSRVSSVPERAKAYINYFMEHDTVTSWRAVIVVLDRGREKAADAIRHLAEPVAGRQVVRLCV